MYFFAISKHVTPILFSQLAHKKKVCYHKDTKRLHFPEWEPERNMRYPYVLC